MAFGDEDVSRLETGGRSNLRYNGGYGLVAQVERLVGGRLQEVVEIDRHIDNRSSDRTEGFGKLSGVFDDLRGGIRGGVQPEDGIIQIDKDECGFLGVELEFRMGSSVGKTGFNKLRESSISQM